MPASALTRSVSLSAMPYYSAPVPLSDSPTIPSPRHDYQPRMAESSTMRHRLFAAMAQASGKSADAFSPRELLVSLRAYINELTVRHQHGHSAYVALNMHSDENQNERFLKHIVALENVRKPGLNLGICRGTGEFGRYVATRATQVPTGTIERTAVMHLVNGFHHVIVYETQFLAARTYIRGFDPLPKSLANKYFVALCADLRQAATAARPVKLDAYALGQQFSGESCDLFAVSAASCSLSEQTDNGPASVAPLQTDGLTADFALHDDSLGERLSPAYFMHSQSQSGLKRLLQHHEERGNTELAQQHTTLIKRHKQFREKQVAYLDNKNQYAYMWVATSIIRERLEHLKRVEVELRDLVAVEQGAPSKPVAASGDNGAHGALRRRTIA